MWDYGLSTRFLVPYDRLEDLIGGVSTVILNLEIYRALNHDFVCVKCVTGAWGTFRNKPKGPSKQRTWYGPAIDIGSPKAREMTLINVQTCHPRPILGHKNAAHSSAISK